MQKPADERGKTTIMLTMVLYINTVLLCWDQFQEAAKNAFKVQLCFFNKQTQEFMQTGDAK